MIFLMVSSCLPIGEQLFGVVLILSKKRPFWTTITFAYFQKSSIISKEKGLTGLYQSYVFKLVTHTGFEPMNACVKGM